MMIDQKLVVHYMNVYSNMYQNMLLARAMHADALVMQGKRHNAFSVCLAGCLVVKSG